MNQDSPSPTPNKAATPEELRAEAREEVRRRVEQTREKREEQDRQLYTATAADTRPRRFWEFAPDSPRGFLVELFADRFILFLGLMALWLLISGIFWLSEAMLWPLYYLIRSLDAATGARLVPWAPWAMWALWGGIFGGCAGYWLVAPTYGHREHRSQILFMPLLAMVVLGVLVSAFS